MSSPIALRNKSKLRNSIISLHQKFSHNTRVEIISDEITNIITPLFINYNDKIKILDFGCGDMKVSSFLIKKMSNISIICSDIHDLLSSDELPFTYIKYDGDTFPFSDNYFDVVLLNDVLHHIPEENQNQVIIECTRVAKFIIIKDHFETGIQSRVVLKIMDFIGNWAYGVELPKRYFTKERFKTFCDNNFITYEMKRSEISLYKHLPRIFQIVSPPSLQFIALLKKKYSNSIIK